MFKRLLFFALPVILLVGVVGFVAWGDSPLPASAQALASLQPGPDVKIENSHGWTVFRPASGAYTTGLIFYPGGRVDYRAYAPLLRPIAAQGYLVVLVPMPLNLANFGVEKAQDVIAAFPEVRRWVIGGHSLGGSMAAQFAINHPGEVAGIVFWAAYPGSTMADLQIQALLISASNDGLATPEKIAAARSLLPSTTRYVVIQGGVHSQFGSYGLQPGDGTASIAPEEQWAQTMAATLEFMNKLGQ